MINEDCYFASMYVLRIMEAKNKSDSDSDLQILLQIHELPVNV